MKLKNLIFVIVSISLIIACGSANKKRAKRINPSNMQINITKSAYNADLLKIICDSVGFELQGDDLKHQKLIVFNGILPIDTLSFLKFKLDKGSENEIIKADLDFDGNCEFIIPDKKNIKSGGTKHYYYMYDTATRNFMENTTLPSYIRSFKLDIKNQRVKLYCPNEDCFAYFKYNAEKTFELVQGEFKPVD